MGCRRDKADKGLPIGLTGAVDPLHIERLKADQTDAVGRVQESGVALQEALQQVSSSESLVGVLRDSLQRRKSGKQNCRKLDPALSAIRPSVVLPELILRQTFGRFGGG